MGSKNRRSAPLSARPAPKCPAALQAPHTSGFHTRCKSATAAERAPLCQVSRGPTCAAAQLQPPHSARQAFSATHSIAEHRCCPSSPSFRSGTVEHVLQFRRLQMQQDGPRLAGALARCRTGFRRVGLHPRQPPQHSVLEQVPGARRGGHLPLRRAIGGRAKIGCGCRGQV